MVLKLGMIGCGTWGSKYIPSIAKDDRGVISSCYRPSSDHIDKLFEYFPNIVVHSSFDAVVKNSDAVIIASPPDSRKEVIELCTYLDVPMMIEKPVTLSHKLYKDILSKSKTPFLVNHVHLFSGAYEALRDSYLANYTNQDVVITSCGGGEGPFRSYSALWDYGPHDISMGSGLGFRKPVVESCLKLEAGLGESYSALLEYERCSHSFSVWNSHTPKRRFFSVSYQDWSAVYDDISENKLVVCGQNINSYDTTPPLQRAISNFIGVCLGDVQDWRWDRTIADDVLYCLEHIESYGG